MSKRWSFQGAEGNSIWFGERVREVNRGCQIGKQASPEVSLSLPPSPLRLPQTKFTFPMAHLPVKPPPLRTSLLQSPLEVHLLKPSHSRPPHREKKLFSRPRKYVTLPASFQLQMTNLQQNATHIKMDQKPQDKDEGQKVTFTHYAGHSQMLTAPSQGSFFSPHNGTNAERS